MARTEKPKKKTGTVMARNSRQDRKGIQKIGNQLIKDGFRLQIASSLGAL